MWLKLARKNAQWVMLHVVTSAAITKVFITRWHVDKEYEVRKREIFYLLLIPIVSKKFVFVYCKV